MELQLNKDRDGGYKILKDGNYRFNVVLRTEGKEVMVIKGFRIPASMLRILPPTVATPKGVYQVVTMDLDFELQMKKKLESLISNSAEDSSASA